VRSGGVGQVLGERPAAGRAVHVHVLHHHQLRAGHRRARQHAGLQRWELLGPRGVGRVGAVVHHRRARAERPRRVGVGGVTGRHLDAVERVEPAAAIHNPHAPSARDQLIHDRPADRAGAEDHV